MQNGRNHWQVAVGKFQRELVFFEDLRITPTPRTIEFSDYRPVIFDPYLVDTVFVTIESQKPAVAAIAEVFQGRNNLFWLQLGVCKG